MVSSRKTPNENSNGIKTKISTKDTKKGMEKPLASFRVADSFFALSPLVEPKQRPKPNNYFFRSSRRINKKMDKVAMGSTVLYRVRDHYEIVLKVPAEAVKDMADSGDPEGKRLTRYVAMVLPLDNIEDRIKPYTPPESSPLRPSNRNNAEPNVENSEVAVAEVQRPPSNETTPSPSAYTPSVVVPPPAPNPVPQFSYIPSPYPPYYIYHRNPVFFSQPPYPPYPYYTQGNPYPVHSFPQYNWSYPVNTPQNSSLITSLITSSLPSPSYSI